MDPMMKKLCLVSIALALLGCTGGCFLLPAQHVDGSQSFYESHPEYANQPGYFHPEQQDDP
jgi:hypothetical protein